MRTVNAFNTYTYKNEMNSCHSHRYHSPRQAIAFGNASLHHPRSRGIKMCMALEASQGAQVAGIEDGVLLVGAGLAGLCAAAALDKAGIPNMVLEQRGELSREGAAIGIWGNGMKALDAIGLGEAIREKYTPLDTIRLCRDNGKVLREFTFEECDGGPHEFYGVSRFYLQQLLQGAVPTEQVVMNADVKSVDLTSIQPRVTLENGTQLGCRLLVGADGVRSVVAESIGQPPASLVGQGGYRGVAEFPGGIPIDAGVICQVWGEGTRAGMYPMSPTEVYWFVTFDLDGERVEMTPEAMKADATQLIKGWQHGIVECVEATPKDRLSRSRFLDRFPSLLGRLSDSNVTLAGDALHPMTPNMGQGGCVALEDGIVLARELKGAWESGKESDLQDALSRYESARAKRCLPLTVRSRGMGAVLQSPFAPVVFARDTVISTVFQPAHFFDHTLFDCGTVDAPGASL